jgi:hypothetical protein
MINDNIIMRKIMIMMVAALALALNCTTAQASI